MKALLVTYLIGFILCWPLSSALQPIEPHFLPEGDILSIHGEERMTYNFEQFRLLLELDENLFHVQEQVGLLEEELSLREQQIEVSERRAEALLATIIELQAAFDAQTSSLETALQTAEELQFLLQQSEAEPRRSFWHPTHLAIEAVLLGVTGLSIYLLLAD